MSSNNSLDPLALACAWHHSNCTSDCESFTNASKEPSWTTGGAAQDGDSKLLFFDDDDNGAADDQYV